MNTSSITEFVGTAIGDTIGLVIANIDCSIHEKIGLEKNYKSIGIISGRIGAGPHIMAADEAVKSTNTKVVKVELPRDTKGGAGHGCSIILASEDVTDVRRAVQIILKELEKKFGDVYVCDSGHLELSYTSSSSFVSEKAFGAPVGKAFAIIAGAPVGIGLVMADTAMKTANVNMVTYASPNSGTSHTNETIITITGDSDAVRQSVRAAREIGLNLLKTMGQEPKSMSTPYI